MSAHNNYYYYHTLGEEKRVRDIYRVQACSRTTGFGDRRVWKKLRENRSIIITRYCCTPRLCTNNRNYRMAMDVPV